MPVNEPLTSTALTWVEKHDRAAPPRITLPWRVALVLVPYTALCWALTAKGLDGDDTRGLVAFILAISGLFVLVQVTWLRGLLRPLSLVLANFALPVLCGGIWGAISRGEAAGGLTAGLVIGLVAVAAVFWLGDLVQLRRRPLVFISYRRSDSAEFVVPLSRLLTERYGTRNVFVDTESIALGEDFRAELVTALRRTDLVLAVIGPGWLVAHADDGSRRLDDPDDSVRLELETALAARLPVVPLLVGGAALPEPDDLPTSLRPLHFLQARALHSSPSEIANEVGELARRLEDRFRVHVRTSFRDVPRRRLRWRVGVALVAAIMVGPPAMLGLQEATASDRTLKDAVLAPDGGLVATGGTTIRLWDTKTGDLVRESPPMNRTAKLSWSPDSKWLVSGGNFGSLVIWDRETLTVARELPGQTGSVTALTWSDDSLRLAVGDDEGTVRVWDRADGRRVSESRISPIRITQLAWAPHQPDLIAAVDGLNGLIITRLGAPEPQPVPDLKARKIAWSPTGAHLAVQQYTPPHLALFDASGAQVDLGGATGVVAGMAWSPDGSGLAAATEGVDVKVWIWRTVAPAQPLPPLVLDKGAPSGIPAVTWSRDGTTVIGTTGNVIRAWHWADQVQVADISRSTDGHEAAVLGWAPTGLVEAQPRAIIAWDLDAGAKNTTISVPVLTALEQWLSE
ncbi:toll/interleukin-1 receptor domain-containing protein [Amycolatopsis lexingtonensis]|uniref:toll/interleukin-1 receptor domain-containing protein n=1 Tax=Amycolatopsis lexingtonensis TaxID=218822 RepID=UPI003F6F43B0